ncbi:CBS domain-containing protein [Actinomadura flavalba]|uniref:CBS domain-containing protein n=1 Tax=Actinomadura flavalba TaxID=1120938 RepID=UPI0003769D20|nr:CBS domain-containing protein [Actinomadura flavalba]
MVQYVRDVMSGEPVAVAADASVTEIAGRMRDQDIGAVLVTDDDRLVGVVTDRDLVTRFLADGGDPDAVTAEAVATPAEFTVDPGDDLDGAVALMRDNAVRRLPVVQDGVPVGIVSLGDLAMERDEHSALADISAAEPNG